MKHRSTKLNSGGLSGLLNPSRVWRQRYEESVKNLAALARVIETVNAASSVFEATRNALSAVRAAFGWEYSSYWQIDPALNALKFVVDSGEVNAEFAAITRTSSFRKGVGLSGRAWDSEDVIFTPDIGDVRDCVRAPVAREAGVRSGICIPIFIDQHVYGTMDFFTNHTIELSDDRMSVFRAVSRLVSSALQKLRDLESQLEAKRNSEAVAEVIRAVTSAEDSQQAIRLTLNAVRQSFDWQYGSFWRVDESRSQLIFGVDSGTVNQEFREITARASFPKGVGLAGRAWAQKSLQFTPDIGEVVDCCRAPVARRAGVRAGVCFPVILFGEVQGTMDFFTVQSISLSKGRLEALQLVSDLVSQSLSKLIESERSRRRNLELQNGIHDVLNVVESATRTMAQLDTSGSEIGGVIKVISNIAEQTNLLALNATIEAARAGTAGKGFAVVAQEVKTLAQETSRSTNDISVRVESIRDASRGAIHAIEQIGRVMNQIQVDQTIPKIALGDKRLNRKTAQTENLMT